MTTKKTDEKTKRYNINATGTPVDREGGGGGRHPRGGPFYPHANLRKVIFGRARG